MTTTSTPGAGEYPPLPEAAYQMGGKGHSDAAMHAYVDADRKTRQLAACNFCLNEAAEARAALAQAAPATGKVGAVARPITASVMLDDGGDKPTYCLMVAYRDEADAISALSALTATPAPTVRAGTEEAVASWLAEQWHHEVANRPLVNVHRAELDAKWRQLLSRVGVDHRARLGPTHEELLAALTAVQADKRGA